jgi:hypothetical protein
VVGSIGSDHGHRGNERESDQHQRDASNAPDAWVPRAAHQQLTFN